MAFGIDDAVTALVAAIHITETIVETIERYKNQKQDYDVEQLLAEVRITAIKKINDADLALTQFERMLIDKNIDIDRPLSEVIAKTPPWRPFEQHRLSQIRRRFNDFSDSIYSAGDDIAALVRCVGRTEAMGAAVVASIGAKRELAAKLSGSRSLREQVSVLHERLASHKLALSGP